MRPIRWDPALATGNELVDQQHEKMFELVNELHESIVECRSCEVQDEVLSRVIEHAKSHFRDEEALMRSVGYPGLLEQRTLHREFEAEVKRMADEY
ncbi:MAG: hypothetical protein FDZ75_02650, partial [Actinobacteria bacterium]